MILIYCYPFNQRKINSSIGRIKSQLSAFWIDLSDDEFLATSERNMDVLLNTVKRLKIPYLYTHSLGELGLSDKDTKTLINSLANLGCKVTSETDTI